MLISEAIETFLTAGRAEGLSGRTTVWYDMILQAVFADVLAEEVVVGVTLGRLRTFLADLRERHSLKRPDRLISAATVAGYTRGLRRFCNWLRIEGYLVEDLAARLKLPKREKRVPRGVSLDDMRAMLAVADARERALLYYMLDTGCRAGEVCGLLRERLDLGRGEAVVLGKGRKERRVFLAPATCSVLRVWLKVPAPHAAGRVFWGLRGPLTPIGLYQVFKRLALRAGVEGRWNPHALRHAYAREHLLNGGDLATLAKLMGHEDVETTMMYSTFADPELARQHARCSPVARMADVV